MADETFKPKPTADNARHRKPLFPTAPLLLSALRDWFIARWAGLLRWLAGPWTVRRMTIIACFACLLFGCYECAFLPRPTVSGYVRDQRTGQPVAGALVTADGKYALLFLFPGGGGWGHAYTDENGFFSIPARSCTIYKPTRLSTISYGVPTYSYIFMPKWFMGITLEVMAPDYKVGRAISDGKSTNLSSKSSHIPFMAYRYELSVEKVESCEDRTDRYIASSEGLHHYFASGFPYPDEYGVPPLLRRAWAMHDFIGILATCPSRPKEIEKPIVQDEGTEAFLWSDLGRVSVKKGLDGPAAYSSVTSGYWSVWESRRQPNRQMFEAVFHDMTAALRRCQNQGASLSSQMDLASDVAVWSWGCLRTDQAKEMLDIIHEPMRFVDSESKSVTIKGKEGARDPGAEGIEEAHGTPILILPTGSLVDTARDPWIRRALREYVEGGGTLLCFAQLHESDWTSLPTPEGEEIEGAGTEERHSRFDNAGVVSASHPILSLSPGTTFDVLIDGRFRKIPKSALVLLRTDGSPTMIAYPLGKGWVVAICNYEDSIALVNPKFPSPEMKRIISNAIVWAKAPGQAIPVTKVAHDAPAGEIPLTLKVSNLSDRDAETVELEVWAPERTKMVSTFRVPFRLASHSQGAIPVSINLKDCLSSAEPVSGIYQCDYRLLAAEAWGDREVQPWAETESGRFALETGSPVPPASP